MAVFTPIEQQQLAHWLGDFDLGRLLSFEGIASGIENSNFFVDTTAGGGGGVLVTPGSAWRCLPQTDS
jgi:Ser/Thr protein kinase RdoA (MazF antagonist)